MSDDLSPWSQSEDIKEDVLLLALEELVHNEKTEGGIKGAVLDVQGKVAGRDGRRPAAVAPVPMEDEERPIHGGALLTGEDEAIGVVLTEKESQASMIRVQGDPELVRRFVERSTNQATRGNVKLFKKRSAKGAGKSDE